MVLSELSYCLHNASKAVLQTQIERFITEWNQVAHPFNWSTQSVALAAPWVPAGEVIRVSFDETTKKKAGLHIAGLARYRNGAGAARQAYRPWRGVHCGLGRRPIPRTRWPGHCRSVPVGCARSRKAPPAQRLNGPYQSRRPLARASLACVAEPCPGRASRSLAAGGYSTKDSSRQLPTAAQVVGRFPINATL